MGLNPYVSPGLLREYFRKASWMASCNGVPLDLSELADFTGSLNLLYGY